MEGKKKADAATGGSSIVDDLFGPKDAAASPSSDGYFSTVFPTPSAAMGTDGSRRAHGGKSSSSAGAGQKGSGGGSPESPYFGSSSIHYGGRDFYAAESHHKYPASNAAADQTCAAPAPKHKEGDKQDTSAATRGDWWQGSLYY